MSEPPPLIPWIEANQGLLSLLALVFALGVAFWEYMLLIGQAKQDRNRDIDIAIDLINRVELSLLAAEGTIGENGIAKSSDVERQAIRVRRMLEAMSAARPHSAAWALALQLAIERMQAAAEQAVGLFSNAHYFRHEVRKHIAGARREIAALRPSARRRLSFRLPKWNRKPDSPALPSDRPPDTTG